MYRYIIFALFLVGIGMILPACQLDAKQPLFHLVAQQTETPTPTLTPVATPSPTNSPTPPASPTPTPTLTPTVTPVPSDRLVLAQQAYTNGNYKAALPQFAGLLADPGADSSERRQALYWRGRSELELGDTSAAIASLKMFLHQYPTDELARAAQFNLGVAYEQNGQLNEALVAYLGAVIPNDPINVYIYERAGDVALRAEDYARAIDTYQAGIDDTEDTAFQVHLREGIAQAELLRDNPTGALVQYDAILSIAEIKDYRAKILVLAAEAHLAADEAEAAYQRYLEAVERYPEAYNSYLSLVELVNAEVPVDEFQRGLVDYYAGAYEPAIAAFDRYLNAPLLAETLTGTKVITDVVAPAVALEPGRPITQTHELTTSETIRSPTSPQPLVEPIPLARGADAVWLTALSWQALGQYNRAISFFQRLIEEYPTDANWAKAHLEIGKSRALQDNISQAKVTFRNFAAQNPTHSLAPEALWRAARLELDGDLLDEAHENLLELAETYPSNDYADDALYWAGQAAFLDRDYEEAATVWATLLEDYPASDYVSFGGYWQARALLTLGQEEAAKKVLSQISARTDEYYRLRARDLLTGNQPHSVPLKLPTLAELVDEQTEAEVWLAEWLGLPSAENLSALSPQVQGDPAFQRGQALLELGLREEALAEFETVKNNWWDNALAMYQLSVYFWKQSLGRLSIITSARLIFLSPAGDPAQAPLFIQRLYYPSYFADLIFAEAALLDLDPALLLAIIRQESLFEQSAESHVGARGLMQVMPATGEYVAERSNFGEFGTDQLWLPYVSVKFGAWYIDQQLGIFEGNQFAALAAYNAGPGYVLEWIERSDDLDIFVESIPFRESRTYIRSIYVNLAAYRRIYGVEAEAPSVN